MHDATNPPEPAVLDQGLPPFDDMFGMVTMTPHASAHSSLSRRGGHA
jgi:hypothetical protein